MCASLRIYKDYVKQVKIKKYTENMLKKNRKYKNVLKKCSIRQNIF